jgi:hypothetical protein
MKFIVLFPIALLSIVLVSCAHNPETGCRDGLFVSDKEKAVCMTEFHKKQLEKNRAEKAPKLSPEERAEILRKRAHAKRAGASIDEFIDAYGEPTQEEIMQGKTVYWYNSSKPFYVIFGNEGLETFMIDRETIANRQKRRREWRAQVVEERRHQDKMNIQKSQLMLNYFNSNRPKKTSTTCTSTGYGNSVTTNCY